MTNYWGPWLWCYDCNVTWFGRGPCWFCGEEGRLGSPPPLTIESTLQADPEVSRQLPT